jgi:Immunoglobulin I-set domain
LAVVASSHHPLTYQWRFRGVKISGAASSTFTIPTSSRGSAEYSVLVSDGVNTVVSENATILVVNGLKVHSPKSRSVLKGKTAKFTVTATGTKPISFQWFFNGDAITGATARQLVLFGVQPAQQGTYSVRVTNPAGTVQSGAATLTVR